MNPVISHRSAEFARGKSIAVLPFSNTSAEASAESVYFSDGVAEEILNALSKVDGLRVAARTSSFAFRDSNVREVGEALDVSVVLEGTVRRAGNKLRISASLVDTENGFQLWSDVYDHQLEDVFLIQDQIAHAIVKALQVKLLGHPGTNLVSPGTDSTEAYDKYLAGRNQLQAGTPKAARQAITLFEEALEFDANYAQAYAGLADSWITLREVGNLTLLDATQRSHAAITQALILSSALPEAQALSLDPLNAAIVENQSLLMAYQGRFESAIEQLQKLDRRAPGRMTSSLAAYRVWTAAGNNEKALEFARRAVNLASASPLALAALVDSNTRLGNLAQARVALDRMNKSSPNNEIAITATMRFYLMTSDFAALDEIASARVNGFLNDKVSCGNDLILERIRWGAIARLALHDARGAREMLEKGIPAPDGLDPRPASVRLLALLARAKKLDGDATGAENVSASARRLAELARAEGWTGGRLDYAMASVAAATNSTSKALHHLRDAIDSGWDDFVFANHDPALGDLAQLPGYRALQE